MNTGTPSHVLKSLLFVMVLASPAKPQDPPSQPPGVEVLTHGPVHESFAAPTNTQPSPGPVIGKEPPNPIDELPPDQRPEGDNVQWVSGYWAWDDEANDFLWVSGCWRDVPPGRRWVPGNWQAVEMGWVWVAGFWATEDMAQLQYLPAPPPTLDQGPSAAAPDPNSVYVPGCWVYQTNRYFWRPGFWVAQHPGWLWTPAHYIWTPSGYLFTDGFWDYPLDQRGLLFAPVQINQARFFAARRPFVPGYVVASDFLLGALFVRQATGHYYFGDYFNPKYANQGFVSWPEYHPVKGVYDPTFAYYRRLHVADPQWETGLRRLYTARRGEEIPRPPRTLSQQLEAVRNVTVNKTQNVAVTKNVNLSHLENVRAVAPLHEIHNVPVTNLGAVNEAKAAVAAQHVRVQEVRKEELEREQKAAATIREGAQLRREHEARILNEGKTPVQHTDPLHSVKWEFPKAPAVVGKPRPPQRVHPGPVVVPKHEDRPIPKFEPPHPIGPPKKK